MNAYPPRIVDPVHVGYIMREYKTLRKQGFKSACILYVLADRRVTLTQLVSEDTMFYEPRRHGYCDTLQKSSLGRLRSELFLFEGVHEGHNVLGRWIVTYEETGVDLVADLIRTGLKSRMLVSDEGS